MRASWKETECPSFPVMKRWVGNGSSGLFIVLFVDETTGVVVWSESLKHKVGEFNQSWVRSSSTDWETATGSITLEN